MENSINDGNDGNSGYETIKLSSPGNTKIKTHSSCSVSWASSLQRLSFLHDLLGQCWSVFMHTKGAAVLWHGRLVIGMVL